MADPNQTPKQGDWKCPCNGCKRSRKLALREVRQLLGGTDILFSWHQAIEFIDKELKSK